MSLDFKNGSALGKRIGCGRFFGDFAPQGRSAAAAGARPPQHDRRGDKDRGVGSDHHADNDGEREVAQHRAAEEKQAKNRDKRHGACKNGSAQRLVDALVHDFLDRPAPAAGQAFPNSIVNDNRIVDRIAGDRQHGTDHCESQLAAQERKHADGHQHVVQQARRSRRRQRKARNGT